MYSFFIIRIFHERFEDLSYLPAWKEMPEGLQKKTWHLNRVIRYEGELEVGRQRGEQGEEVWAKQT